MSSDRHTSRPPAFRDGDGNEPDVVLSVEGLSTSFFTREGEVRAVRDVDFSVRRGEVVGIVGESGSGKSITARSIIGLVPPPGEIVGGKVLFKGSDYAIDQVVGAELLHSYGGRVELIEIVPEQSTTRIVKKLRGV